MAGMPATGFTDLMRLYCGERCLAEFRSGGCAAAIEGRWDRSSRAVVEHGCENAVLGTEVKTERG